MTRKRTNPKQSNDIAVQSRLAFTLLEVLVGMALMAGLVASCLTALSRYQSQLGDAEEKQRAIVFADELMNAWVDSSQGLPGPSIGVVPAQPEYVYRTQLIARRNVCGVSLDVLQLDIGSRRSSDSVDNWITSLQYVRRPVWEAR